MAEPIKTKCCSKCKQIKPLSEFYENKHCTKDGHLNSCKICELKYAKQYRQTEKYKIIQHKSNSRYRKTEKGKITEKRYRQNEKGKATQKHYHIRHPEQRKAGNAITNAIKFGRLSRPDIFQCHYCPAQAKEYHHPDYSKPLYVFPVCIICHKIIHKN